MNAITGLLVLLSLQLKTQDFAPGNSALTTEGKGYYSHEAALGGFFLIDFPNDWSEEEKNDFDWAELRKETDRFQKIDYDNI